MIFPESFMGLMGNIPSTPRPLKVLDSDRRKKLLDLASFLLQGTAVESTERTVRFLVMLAQTSHEPDPVPFLQWQSTRTQSDMDMLAQRDPNHCKTLQRIVPQMRFAARIGR